MAAKILTAGQKQALAVLRETMGGISDEKRQAQRNRIRLRKAIRKALESDAATVPQLAERTDATAHEVLWHVTGMRKYGEVRESGEDGDYPLYALIAGNQTDESH